ncbi:unnamed protein product [Schistocephalus solidus]|uniref:NADH-quinone oxidoreductase subunit F n=1 Tax=Schistocephalus solidus TaxID=70667 RepID=A0A183SBC5_SCHSO|nr:unnamed protein product [Schistocephalus solidus]
MAELTTLTGIRRPPEVYKHGGPRLMAELTTLHRDPTIPPEVYKHGGPRLMAELTTLFQEATEVYKHGGPRLMAELTTLFQKM